MFISNRLQRPGEGRWHDCQMRVRRLAGLMIAKHRTGLWQGRYGVITHPPAIQRGTLPPPIQEFIGRSEGKQKVAGAALDARELAMRHMAIVPRLAPPQT